MDRNNKKHSIQRIAFLVACAAVLQIAESLIPHPLPGVRFGLANIITLVALINIGFGAALEIAVFRSIISSFILGTFLSPAFFLSLSGSVISTLVMGLALRMSMMNRRIYLSVIGISILGSFTHNMVQILLVYATLIRHEGVFFMLPWLGMSGIVMGWISGMVTVQVCRLLETGDSSAAFQTNSEPANTSFRFSHYKDLATPVHRIPAELKIAGLIAMGITLIAVTDLRIYGAIAGFLMLIVMFSGMSLMAILRRAKNLSPILLFSFMLPVLLQKAGETILIAGPVTVTMEGLHQGMVFMSRLFLLMLGAMVLIHSTSPDALIKALKKILRPIRLAGLSEKRAAEIIILSWNSVPELWDRIRQHIRGRVSGGIKFRTLLNLLSEVIVVVYLQSE